MSATRRPTDKVAEDADNQLGLADLERGTKEARELFEQLLVFATADAQRKEIHDVERGIFARLLTIGLAVLKLFLEKRGTGWSPAVKVGKGAEAKVVPYHSDKPITYFSVFGKLSVPRAYFWSPTSAGEGAVPLDASLNLPDRRYSYVLQEFAELFATRGAYDKVTEMLEKVLRVTFWKQGIQLVVREAGADVQQFYEQKPAPDPATEGTILAVGADGKGVPMRQEKLEAEAAPRPKPNKGETPLDLKLGKKRMGIVTTVYTTDPKVRTAETIVRALVDQDKSVERRDPIEPKNKRVRVTFKGTDVAFDEVMRQVEQRDPHGKMKRVALVDGEKRLARRDEFKDWLNVLDIMHVLERLWNSSNALLGQGKPEAKALVRESLLTILEGKVTDVIKAFGEKLTAAGDALSFTRREVVEGTVTYFTNNVDRMRYDEYLAAGLPIATGVVESACGVLVGERADKKRMLWREPGVQSLLDLRAVDQSGDWEEFCEWRTDMERERLYPTPMKAAG